MKKIYILLLTTMLTAFSFGQNVVITTVVDGTLSALGCDETSSGGSSNPKIIELYVSGTVNFENYRLQTEANGVPTGGSISWNNGANISALGTVTDSFVYLVYVENASTNVLFSEMYPSITSNYIKSSSMPNGNGNDAYRLVSNNDDIIDQFGNPLDISGSNDYSAVWAYQDGYAKRKSGFGPNGGNFDPDSFDYGNKAFVSPNNNCQYMIDTITLGQGSYGDVSVKDSEIEGLSIYPNPISGNILHITSHNNTEKNVAIFDVLGKEIIRAKTTNKTLNVSALNAGIYIVKITEDGKTTNKKLLVK